MEGIREEILDELREDYCKNAGSSMIVEFLRGKSERDLRVCAGRLLDEDPFGLQAALVSAIQRSAKVKLGEIAPHIMKDAGDVASSDIKGNRRIRARLAELSAGPELLSRKQLEALLEIMLPKLPRPAKSTALMIEREGLAEGSDERGKVQERIEHHLRVEASQWLLDRGYPTSELTDSTSERTDPTPKRTNSTSERTDPTPKRTNSSLRAWDIPIDLATTVLARHKEIALEDEEFESQQAQELLDASGDRPFVVPVRINALSGASLRMISNGSRVAFFAQYPPVGKGNVEVVSLGKAYRLKDIDGLWSFIEENLWGFIEENRYSSSKALSAFAKNGARPKGCPSRYSWYFLEPDEQVDVSGYVAQEQEELDGRSHGTPRK